MVKGIVLSSSRAESGSYSLATRLQVGVALVLLLFLGVTGAIVDRAYKSSEDEAVTQRLQLMIYTLLAAAEEVDGSLSIPDHVEIPGLAQPESGLFAFVRDVDRSIIWRSSSAEMSPDLGAVGGLANPGRGVFHLEEKTDGFSSPVFVASMGVAWDTGYEVNDFSLLVVEDMAPYKKELWRFRQNLWGGLAISTIILLLMQSLLLRWGLRPLKRVERELAAIQQGEAEHLSNAYPLELSGMTRGLNDLLEQERAQQSRFRNSLADLAHSLKTPLAVLRGLTQSVEQTDKQLVHEEQLNRLDELVSYQLHRAVIAGKRLLVKPVMLGPIAEKIGNSLGKVYADKGVVFSYAVERSTVFYGNDNDLFEVLGNLMDNACKYGAGQVSLAARRHGKERQIIIEVSDNGPGIPLVDRERILERGVRLDSRPVGQGIGMAVVADVVDSYGGSLEIADSELGGALIRVVL